jgi:hypothetical protein
MVSCDPLLLVNSVASSACCLESPAYTLSISVSSILSVLILVFFFSYFSFSPSDLSPSDSSLESSSVVCLSLLAM